MELEAFPQTAIDPAVDPAAQTAAAEVCTPEPEMVEEGWFARHKWNLVLIPLVFVVVMGVLELLGLLGAMNPVIMPRPSAIAGAWWTITKADWFLPNLATTVWETWAGFFIGCGLGVVLGILLANVSWFRRLAYPYIIAFQVMPKVVLAPIFLTWFGFGMNSKIAVSAAICFFPVVVNTLLGLESLEENSVLLMRSLVATRWQTFVKVAFPNALPAIFAGIETSATIALIGSLVGEFVTARRGLGLLLTTFNMELKMPMTFGVILWVSIVGLIMYGIVVFAKHRIVFWQRDWRKEIL
ncbi:MAG: ABC transporter permease [Actinobacteria bacterium]|nr:ABC transporter permease [Actinomycetota bacterium]